MKTPKELGYYFPAEWHPHAATWLSYPHNEASWPGKISTIFPAYHSFIKEISRGERVNINVTDEAMGRHVREELEKIDVDPSRISLYLHPTNDAWCRDHGPAFLIAGRPDLRPPKVIVNWKYNAWGNKYPHDLDNTIPERIASLLDLPVFSPGIVMEGGSVEFNGAGTVLTTTACLLHENRNPSLNREQIEQALQDFYGVEQVLWLGEGIEGDDTNGHIDDMTRFVSPDTVITMVEPDRKDANHFPLHTNLQTLKSMRLLNGKSLNVVEIPMPDPVYYDGQRLPASYANFYICNAGVLVPTFQCPKDSLAIDLLSRCFPDRPVIGIDSVEIIWGLGSWHCLSQQEPERPSPCP
ncbi:agmatine/peptidylarginine deiminase [Syntrophus buswellii]|jgi:agmatine deiminase|uniref:agmatine deiminase family protein n=1 Tax=Syntrophus buswellii TaxID=43774 RepID=UPI0009C46652|nr:MAG: putative agmatine deiminase [Syntrophus sp. PtaB.Bin138]